MSRNHFKINKGVSLGPVATQPVDPENGDLIYNSTTSQFEKYEGGVWKTLGSAAGGVTNLITNGNADDAAVSIFTPYLNTAQNRPVTGTGGSPTVTTSITSTNPLTGTKSYLLTKPASNTQGQGWSVLTSTLDKSYRAKSLKISGDYIVNSGTFVAGNNSGTPSDGDVIWYFYDITNSKLVEPSNIKMFSNSSTNSDKFEATIQFDFDCTAFRLIAHCASTSALAYELKVDNITVSPQVYVYASPKTDFVLQSTAPVLTGSTSGTLVVGTGGGALNTVEVARDGQEILARYNFRRGTTGFVDVVGALVFPLPLGYSTILSQYEIIGYGDITVVGTANPAARVVAKIFTGGFILDASDAGLVNSAGGLYATNANSISIVIRFKAVGLSSSTQMSDGYDGRVIAARVAKSGSQALSAGVPAKIVGFLSIEDKSGMFNSSLNRFDIKTAGDYFLSGATVLSATTANLLLYHTNGVFSSYFSPDCSSNRNSGGVLIPSLKAGDYVEVYILSTVANTLLDNNASTYFSLSKIQGPQAIAASEPVNCSYNVTNSPVATHNATTIVIYNLKNFDTHGAFNPATGVFTAPIAGKYRVSARARVSIGTGVSYSQQLGLVTTGTGGGTVAEIGAVSPGGFSVFPTTTVSETIYLNAGQTIRADFYHFNSASASVTIQNGNISIEKVG